jgi:hypothetical protein
MFKVGGLHFQSLASVLFTLANKFVDQQYFTDYSLLIKPVIIFWLNLLSDLSPQLQLEFKYAIV